MNITRGLSYFTPQKIESYTTAMTWVSPCVFIPALRYAQDRKNRPEVANELFFRDFTSYAIGSGAFLGLSIGAQKLFNKFNIIKQPHFRKFTAFLIGLAGYLLYSGIGAVKTSEAIVKIRNKKNPKQQNFQDRLTINNPVKSESKTNQAKADQSLLTPAFLKRLMESHNS